MHLSVMFDETWTELPVLEGELNDWAEREEDLHESITESSEDDWCYDDSDTTIDFFCPEW